jgi:hypothetical protein
VVSTQSTTRYKGFIFFFFFFFEEKKSDVFITFRKVLIIFFKIVIINNMTHVVIISGLECDLYRNKTLFFLLFSCFVLDSVF